MFVVLFLILAVLVILLVQSRKQAKKKLAKVVAMPGNKRYRHRIIIQSTDDNHGWNGPINNIYLSNVSYKILCFFSYTT